MSLFLKIFLWFWLAMALIVGAITVVNWSTRTAPLARQFRTFMSERITSGSQTTAQIYENEGVKGLEEYFERRKNRRRINSIGFFTKEKELIAGNLKLSEVNELFEKSLISDEPQFKRLPEKFYGSTRVILDDGKTYVYVIELRRFQPPPFFTTRLILQLLAVLLIGGLFCYFLARYLTLPIMKLRGATKELAGGNFETRVAGKLGKRRDELAYLAKDFDEMAERIESLINSEKRLTQDISHELRSPLARMNVALELVKTKSTPESEKLLHRIETESERLNEMIGQLLTLSKLETGSQNFEKHEINLTKLVENIAEDANFEAKANDKEVVILQKDETKVFGNEQLLRSAIENVLRNAVRYTKTDSNVEITIENQHENASLSITDYGVGVPEAELEKLFKPFYRIQEARDRKSGGTGLGLAIAERAVNNHNGIINAQNTKDGLLVNIKIPLL